MQLPVARSYVASPQLVPPMERPKPLPVATEPVLAVEAPAETPAVEPAVEPAPVEPAPAEPAPAEPAPVEEPPVEPAPVEPTPVEPPADEAPAGGDEALKGVESLEESPPVDDSPVVKRVGLTLPQGAISDGKSDKASPSTPEPLSPASVASGVGTQTVWMVGPGSVTWAVNHGLR